MNLNSTARFASILLLAAGIQLSANPIIYSMSAPDSNGTVTYNGVQRDAWLNSAESGFAVGQTTGTPSASTVSNLFGGTWAQDSALTRPGTGHWLTVKLDTGSTWGTGPLWGSWHIDPAFWSTYGNAVISMHVGNGAGDPDWFLWEITPFETDGRFYYKRDSGGGGGLSNIFLWGGGEPTRLPDNGSTLILAGISLLALAFLRRRHR